MTPQKTNKKERKTGSKTGNKRSHLVVPLIVISMLICIIATIILGSGIGRTQENTEIGKDVEPNKEEILAETKTLQAGETYIVAKSDIYRIELHGGSTKGGSRGFKLSFTLRLKKGVRLTTVSYSGGLRV